MSLISISGKLKSGKDTVARMIQGLDARFADHVIIDTLCSSDGYNWLTESDWEIKRFADELKDTVCRWIGCTREQLEDRDFKEKPLGEEWDKWEVVSANGSPSIQFSTREKAEEVAKTYGIKMNPNGTLAKSKVRKVVMTPRKLMQLLGTEAGREIIHPDIWVNALFADYPTKDEISCGLEEYQEPKWIIPDTRFPNEANAVKEKSGILIRINRNNPDGSIYGWGNSNADHPSETALDSYKDWDHVIDNDDTLEDLLQKVKQICKKENIV